MTDLTREAIEEARTEARRFLMQHDDAFYGPMKGTKCGCPECKVIRPMVTALDAERAKVDCGGVNCGKCQQCLTVNFYFAQQALEGAKRELEAVDEQLRPWEPDPESEVGAVGRVQTILNLKADRVALDAERARNENTEKFLSKTQDRVELLESLNLRALARITDLEAVAEAARRYANLELRDCGESPCIAAECELVRALAVLEEPQ